MKFIIAFCLRALLLCFAFKGACANDTTPLKPLTIISGYGSGGLTDQLARLIAQYLSTETGMHIVVTNLPGVGGARAAQVAFQAPAQTPVILLSDSSLLHANTKPEVHSVRLDKFFPIGSPGQTMLALCVATNSDIKNLDDLAQLTQSSATRVSFGTPGIGTVHQLIAERWVRAIKGEAVHVPYQGGSHMLPDLFEKRLTFGVMSVALAAEQASTGRLRVLAVTGAVRSQFLPAVPVLSERYPGLTASTRAYIVASPNMNQFLQERLTHAWSRIYDNKNFKQDLLKLKLEPHALDQREVRSVMAKEIASLGNPTDKPKNREVDFSKKVARPLTSEEIHQLEVKMRYFENNEIIRKRLGLPLNSTQVTNTLPDQQPILEKIPKVKAEDSASEILKAEPASE